LKQNQFQNKKERDGKIYALYISGKTYKDIKSEFNLPVKELREIVTLKAIDDVLEKHPHIGLDQAVWRAIMYSGS
jgi:hypothetical protein